MAKNYYDGPVSCQGCGRPGSLEVRRTRDCLCGDCQRRLELGTLVEKDMTLTEYGSIEEFVHTMLPHRFTWNSRIEYAMVDFFRSFNCPSGLYSSGQHRLLKINYDCNTHHITLPKFLVDAASSLCQTFHEEGNNVEEQRRNLRSEAEQQLNEERNKIYNEGVAYGRKLLFHLNNGDIALKEFEAEVKKY